MGCVMGKAFYAGQMVVLTQENGLITVVKVLGSSVMQTQLSMRGSLLRIRLREREFAVTLMVLSTKGSGLTMKEKEKGF